MSDILTGSTANLQGGNTIFYANTQLAAGIRNIDTYLGRSMPVFAPFPNAPFPGELPFAMDIPIDYGDGGGPFQPPGCVQVITSTDNRLGHVSAGYVPRELPAEYSVYHNRYYWYASRPDAPLMSASSGLKYNSELFLPGGGVAAYTMYQWAANRVTYSAGSPPSRVYEVTRYIVPRFYISHLAWSSYLGTDSNSSNLYTITTSGGYFINSVTLPDGTVMNNPWTVSDSILPGPISFPDPVPGPQIIIVPVKQSYIHTDGSPLRIKVFATQIPPDIFTWYGTQRFNIPEFAPMVRGANITPLPISLPLFDGAGNRIDSVIGGYFPGTLGVLSPPTT